MAKNSNYGFVGHGGKKRPGVHSKNKNSNVKSSKNYKKKYRGQGKL